MKFGLYTICEFDNEAPEPEGIVLYNKMMPDIGTEVTLSDGNVWVVTCFNESIAQVYVKLKE